MSSQPPHGWTALRVAVGLLLLPVVASADSVTFRTEDSSTRTVDGEVLVEAADGGILLRGDDGRLWLVQPDQITDRTAGQTPPPIDQDEMSRRMLEEFPKGFQVFRTAHYLILHQGQEAYAKECAFLFESLYRAFTSYWKNQRVLLDKPMFPLVALVLRDHDAFLQHATADIGDSAANMIGYFHLQSNRMTTFRVPNIERNIATLIHEATHQLAYNCGLQTRLADNPMWVSEGLATYFESPDLSNPRGWRGVGRVNTVNLNRWKRYFPNRPEDSLVTLVADDSRFRSAATAEAAYGESWALSYFLIRTRRDDYVKYLQRLGEGQPLSELTGRQRIEMIESCFQTTIAELDRQFVQYINRVR